MQTGKIEEGIALTKKAAAANPELIWAVGWAYAKAGKIDEVNALLHTIEKTPFNAFSLVIMHIFTPWLTTGFFAEKLRKNPLLIELLKPIIDSIPKS